MSHAGPGKSSRSRAASLLGDWGGPAPWPEPMCLLPVHVSPLRERCRPVVPWEACRLAPVGERNGATLKKGEQVRRGYMNCFGSSR